MCDVCVIYVITACYTDLLIFGGNRINGKNKSLLWPFIYIFHEILSTFCCCCWWARKRRVGIPCNGLQLIRGRATAHLQGAVLLQGRNRNPLAEALRVFKSDRRVTRHSASPTDGHLSWKQRDHLCSSRLFSIEQDRHPRLCRQLFTLSSYPSGWEEMSLPICLGAGWTLHVDREPTLQRLLSRTRGSSEDRWARWGLRGRMHAWKVFQIWFWERKPSRVSHSLLFLPKHGNLFTVVTRVYATPFSHIHPTLRFISNMGSHSKDILYRPQREIKAQSFKSFHILLSLVGSVVFRPSVRMVFKVNPGLDKMERWERRGQW